MCHLCREPISFLLKMDLDLIVKDFVKVVSVTYSKKDVEVMFRENEEEQAS